MEMIQIKGYGPSKKCSTYIKKMISRKFWKVNNKISTIGQIADKLNISQPTVRKVIKQFERNGIIKNWGSLGFYLINTINSPQQIDKCSYYLKEFKTTLTAYDLLNAGAIKVKNWIVGYIKATQQITGLNEVSGTIINTDINEIRSLSSIFLSLEDILSISDTTLFTEKMKIFNRQRDILPISKIVLKYKKDLGIDE
jgi:DNA-binding transcriptional regulator YhcF (GntR family)